MLFDPENHVVKLCAQGMELEGAAKREEARAIFYQAWDASTNDRERFIAAHYISRHQPTVKDKLVWDKKAIELALAINDEHSRAAYSSLYLNIAKCYEDMGDKPNALVNYKLAENSCYFLNTDGYGDMIRAGIQNGINRVTTAS